MVFSGRIPLLSLQSLLDTIEHSIAADTWFVIEIDHGNGFVTRYAHAEKLAAAVGDVVVRGQKVATVGSTGRSTGPHLHFEVLKNGKPLNPRRFLKRAS